MFRVNRNSLQLELRHFCSNACKICINVCIIPFDLLSYTNNWKKKVRSHLHVAYIMYNIYPCWRVIYNRLALRSILFVIFVVRNPCQNTNFLPWIRSRKRHICKVDNNTSCHKQSSTKS